MPKRATLTYTSEDAPKVELQKLYVYYCKYSGKHVLTADCDLEKLPRRRTDGSYIVDTEEHTIKLYTEDGGVKYIKRHNGNVEKQHRMNVGKLHVAYRSEPDGRYVYVLSDAVTSYANKRPAQGTRTLVPPCIWRGADGAVECRLDIEDKAQKACLVKVSGDSIRIHVTCSMGAESMTTEVLQMFAKILGCRITQLRLRTGGGRRNRIMSVDHLAPDQVFEKLQAYQNKLQQQAEDRVRHT